ncbi:hypothetical protein KCU65_g367, partial [Aureobasidium melanogenum]
MAPTIHPVVCAAPLSVELMTRFILTSGFEEEWWECVFIDSITHYYDEISSPPVECSSNPHSPFINKTPQECHNLLLKLHEDTDSEITTEFFMILDERSTRDDTVVLVSITGDRDDETGERGALTLRASFEVSAQELMLYEIGHWSIEEDLECVSGLEDDVYRASRLEDQTWILPQMMGKRYEWLLGSPTLMSKPQYQKDRNGTKT